MLDLFQKNIKELDMFHNIEPKISKSVLIQI